MFLETSFKLIIAEGPSPGQVLELTRPEIVIGRDPDADICISSPVVSRRHARLIRLGEQYLLEDLGSSNGTFVNGHRITEITSLKPGDSIRLGQVVILNYDAPEYAKETVVHGSIPSQNKSDVAETVLGEEVRSPAQKFPPQLVVTIAGEKAQAHRLDRERFTIGRAEDNDIVINSRIVSRYHARLERANGGYRLVPLPEASNPVFFEGRPLSLPRRLNHKDMLRIGGQEAGLMVTLTYDSPTEAAKPAPQQIIFGDKTKIQIGRDPSNDVLLDAPQVSRFHAQIERVGRRYRARDLRSANGTFVNDQRIEGEVWLKPDDTIRIGSHRFVMGQDQLAQYDETSGLRVEATGLNKWVRKDLNILQDISVVFQPREFIVVVGQSGGGKSTLVDSIAGYRPATQGRVQVNGIDVYRNFDAVRNDIGFVPQKDIIHMELSVYQALDYAAQLRMPADTTKEERHRRVMEVMEDLDLVHRKDVPINGLSGGQQKRVSIGVELLTKPGLFFLDEPTSGLDPGTETALMQLMRRLADQGRTIVLVTHATKNVMLADKVIFLARGGYLAWFGPPDEALAYFDQFRSERDRRAGNMEFDDIYAILDDSSKGSPADWAKRFTAHPAYQQYILQPLQANTPAAALTPPAPVQRPTRSARRKISSLRQLIILSARNLKILTRDRFSLALMLASAPLVGLLDVLLSFLLGRDPFNFSTGNMPNVLITMFLLTVYGVMVGGLAQMREIVKEQDIYRRERLVNLMILPYVLSKVWVAALLALYQAAAYVIIHYLAFNMPGGISEFIFIYITLALATMAGMMLGLFASALAPNANSAPMIVILLMLPQIVLGGALVPLPPAFNAMISTRWAFEGLMSISGAASDVAADVCWQLPEEIRKAMTLADKNAHNCRCMGVNVLNPNSCNYPGVGIFYHPAIDEPEPTAPPALGDPPAEPVLPERPIEPANQSDSIAMAEFFAQLKGWEENVNQIQTDYKRSVEAYQAQGEVFKAETIAYQEALANWQIARVSAVEPAEGLISQFYDDFGWTIVNKEDRSAYFVKIFSTWFAQALIILVLFGAILFLQKRKDVV